MISKLEQQIFEALLRYQGIKDRNDRPFTSTVCEGHESGSPEEGRDELINAMIAVYNRALGDAASAVRLNQVKETDYTTYGGKSGVQQRTRYSAHFSKEWEGDSQYWVEVDKDSILDLKI